jgi:hypothetical protein
MQNIVTDINSLQQQIEKLQAKERQQVEEFNSAKSLIAYNLSPAQLFKRAANAISPKPAAGQLNLDLVTGLVAGAISNRFYAPKSSGLIRKLTAPIVQYVVTNYVKNKVAKIRTKNRQGN